MNLSALLFKFSILVRELELANIHTRVKEHLGGFQQCVGGQFCETLLSEFRYLKKKLWPIFIDGINCLMARATLRRELTLEEEGS